MQMGYLLIADYSIRGVWLPQIVELLHHNVAAILSTVEKRNYMILQVPVMPHAHNLWSSLMVSWVEKLNTLSNTLQAKLLLSEIAG